MKSRITSKIRIKLKTLIGYELNQRLLKFCVTGGVSTVFNYLIFFYLYKFLGIYYFYSAIVGYTIGLLGGYLLNKNWTFSKKIIKGKRYIFRYIIAQLLGLVSNQIALSILVEIIHFNPLYANVLSLGLAAIVSFILIEFIVFHKPKI